ncbi:MAG: 1-deoxy-D-xylulose-5-phosphate reductoisomerase [Alphaproteobacteria bacterium]|nr:1-deoxy-D-xylulose-5-phosphate reductoisomerase [Alphaproteobacteria bacterium]
MPAIQPAARRVTILGSTGSIGRNTVDLIARDPERFQVEALTGHRNVQLLAEQARQLRARLAVIADPELLQTLREALAGSGIEAAAGTNSVTEAAQRPADWVMAAIVGAAGLKPTLAAVRRGATVALANKECLVCAGDVMIAEVRAHNASMVPVDSEHSAIFQVFEFDRPETVERVILTASGGPFRSWPREKMAKATPEQAIAHPNWSMGAKISVDSASMMNKGLETIEAFHLFPIAKEQIEVVVHPQSVVHSMVSYADGSVLAQMGTPDMRTPIAYALAWPKRMKAPVERLDLIKVGTLTFEMPDETHFPALRLAREALAAGGSAPAMLNAANEVAVAAFLDRKIGFLEIAAVVEDTLAARPATSVANLDDVAHADAAGRRAAEDAVARRAAKRLKQ